ncbi:MAG: hypothetical protein ACQEQC_05590 [Elusimicrobiota bacterium]
MSNKILKIKGDNPEKEREFHLKYLLSLSIKERYDIFFGMGEFTEELLKNGRRQRTNRKTSTDLEELIKIKRLKE